MKGDPHTYEVRDAKCLGRACLNLHPTAIRGATNSGSRFSGWRYGCGRREYYGCPQPTPDFDRKLAAERRKEGMRNV